MEYYAGIDVSLELSSACVVDAKGKIVKEAKISSDPVALVTFFKGSVLRSSALGLRPGRCCSMEFSIRGILRGFGLKMGMVMRGNFEARVRELCAGHSIPERICAAMLAARSALQTEYTKLHKAMLTIVRKDEVCRRLMTTPGVGPLVAITFKTGIDDPSRIGKSKAVGHCSG